MFGWSDSKMIAIGVAAAIAVILLGVLVIWIRRLHAKRMRQDEEIGMGGRAGEGWAGRTITGL